MKTKEKLKEKLKLINFKASAKERDIIKRNADIYAGGNVGGFIKLVCADRRLLKTNRIRIKKIS